MKINTDREKVIKLRKDGKTWTNGMPTNAGIYQIRAIALGDSTYETSTSKPVTFSILKLPIAADFEFTPPESLIYDSNEKVPKFTQPEGTGEVTIKYFKDGNSVSEAKNVGTYTVKIDVAAGDNYAAATDLTGVNWKFTITEAPQPDNPDSDSGSSGVTQPDSGTETTEELNVLTTEVELNGKLQKIMVRGRKKILPEGTQLVVKVVDEHADLDPITDVEHAFHYEFTLLNAVGKQLAMPLAEKVELLLEVVDWLDKGDMEIILAQLGEDIQFEENLVNTDGKTFVGVWTDHFSPYSLFDMLSESEKAELEKLTNEQKTEEKIEKTEQSSTNSPKTGDEVTYFTISGLGLIMTLALGLMFKLKSSKKEFEE